MTSPRRILVIGLRRIGDLLLATPLIRTLKQAWPQAMIDVLLPTGTEGIVEGNPDVDATLLFVRGKGNWALLRRLTRRYDLAINLQPEDRGHFLALVAAPRRVSIVPPQSQPGWRWKRWLSTHSVAVNLHNTHAVIQYLQLADTLRLPRATALVPPRAVPNAATHGNTAYAVVHPAPMYCYKAWPETSWAALIAALVQRGLRVMITGGPEPAEHQLGQRLAAASGEPAHVSVMAGALRLAELTPLLEAARVFIGPDTATTHLAAAAGVPTVALFGPSNPRAWGPWPLGCQTRAGSPWQFKDAHQQHGNVWLLQGTHARRPGCIPCLREGCDNRRDSAADCLDQLEVARVLQAVDTILGT